MTPESPPRRRRLAKPVSILSVSRAGRDHQVVSVQGGRKAFRSKVCTTCPWRIDQVGTFPAEAFVISADTAYDMSTRVFACHEVGTAKPAACAGFLLRGADHNMAVRLGKMSGDYIPDPHADGVELHDSYRAMAEANGVPSTADCLSRCR